MYSFGGLLMKTTPSLFSTSLHYGLKMSFFNSTRNWWFGCCLNLYQQNTYIYNWRMLLGTTKMNMLWQIYSCWWFERFSERYILDSYLLIILMKIDATTCPNNSKQQTRLFLLTSWNLSWKHNFFHLFQIWFRRLLISSLLFKVMQRSLWAGKKCIFPGSTWTTMNSLNLSTKTSHLI